MWQKDVVFGSAKALGLAVMVTVGVAEGVTVDVRVAVGVELGVAVAKAISSSSPPAMSSKAATIKITTTRIAPADKANV